MNGRSVHDEIVALLVERAYQQPLIENVYRGEYVECLVKLALGEEWVLTANWDPWDLERKATRVRLEVKQSAARQTWTQPAAPQHPHRPRFDIAPRSGYYDGTDWVETPPQRHADLYVFAWHSEVGEEIADHRLPEQWEFYVAPESDLPAGQKSIGIEPLKQIARSCVYGVLAEVVRRTVAELPSFKVNSGP